MYTCRIHSIIDVASLLYNWKLKITLGIYIGLYTITTIEEKQLNVIVAIVVILHYWKNIIHFSILSNRDPNCPNTIQLFLQKCEKLRVNGDTN